MTGHPSHAVRRGPGATDAPVHDTPVPDALPPGFASSDDASPAGSPAAGTAQPGTAQAARAHLATFVELSAQVFCVTDFTGTVVWCNASFERALGVGPKRLLGIRLVRFSSSGASSLTQCLPPGNFGLIVGLMKAFLQFVRRQRENTGASRHIGREARFLNRPRRFAVLRKCHHRP